MCDRLVQNIDYAPTYLAAAGIEQPEYMTGLPLQPLCKGEEPRQWREDLYYHYYDYPAEHRVLRHDGVSDGRYKLIHFYDKDKDGNVVMREDELYLRPTPRRCTTSSAARIWPKYVTACRNDSTNTARSWQWTSIDIAE